MPKPRSARQLRRLVRERAQGCCAYCLSQEGYATQGFSVEHITPQDRGGDSAADNLALACQGCNNFTYNTTSAFDPGSRQMVLLFHPRQQQWHEHFAWNHDCTLIIGLTPTGRATVEELHLNRPGVLNLRHLLLLVGRHPPQLHPPE